MKKYDLEIISGMEFMMLATKIKIVIKEYDKVQVSRNPRIGIGVNISSSKLNPRLYYSTSAEKKYKNVIVRNDQYDIRKKDNLEERIIELSEILDIQNPYVLYSFIKDECEKKVGKQYFLEFN